MPLTRKRDACIIFLRDGIGYINNSAAVFLHFCLGRGAAYLRRSQSGANISEVQPIFDEVKVVNLRYSQNRTQSVPPT